MSSPAAYPSGLGGPLRPFGWPAYAYPYPTALAGFCRASASGLLQPWHSRNYLKVIVRGFTPLLYAYATKGTAPLTAYPRAA